jgi:hypothetical protein
MTQVGDRFLSTSAKSKTTTACTSQPIALAACAAQLAPKPDINTAKTPHMHIASLSISVYSLSMYVSLSSQKQLRYATDPSPQSSPLKLDRIAQSYHSPLDKPLYLLPPCSIPNRPLLLHYTPVKLLGRLFTDNRNTSKAINTVRCTSSQQA